MSNSEITRILTTTRLSQFLNSHEIHVLTKYGKTVKFSAGNVIVKQGTIANGLYIILEGTAINTAKILGEGFTKLSTLGHGNFIGEVSIIDQRPSTISTVATSEMICLFITDEYLEMLSLLHHQIYYQLKRAIANEIYEYLRHFHKQIREIMQQTDMVTRSLFGEVIKSLHKPVLLNVEETEFYISQLPEMELFHYFTKEEKMELLKYFELVKAPVETTLIQEDSIDSTFYIVLFGAIQSNIIHDNKVAKLSVLGPLEIFSGISILDDSSPSIIQYMTCERAILLRISQDNIALLQKNNIRIWYKIFDLVCQSFVTLARSAEKLDIRLNSELYNR